jgi:hypothetical protein
MENEDKKVLLGLSLPAILVVIVFAVLLTGVSKK